MNNEDTLQLIYQFLENRQFSQALSALQEESGVKYDYAVLAGKPNRLRVILNEHLELSNALLGVDPTLQNEMSSEQSLVRKFQSEQSGKINIIILFKIF